MSKLLGCILCFLGLGCFVVLASMSFVGRVGSRFFANLKLSFGKEGRLPELHYHGKIFLRSILLNLGHFIYYREASISNHGMHDLCFRAKLDRILQRCYGVLWPDCFGSLTVFSGFQSFHEGPLLLGHLAWRVNRS